MTALCIILAITLLWLTRVGLTLRWTSADQHVLSEHAQIRLSQDNNNPLAIPSFHDSAILARRMLKLGAIGTLATTFPRQDHSGPASTAEVIDHANAVANAFAGSPIALMEYFASCSPRPSDPTLLALSLSTAIRNVRAGSNVSLSLTWQVPAGAPPPKDKWQYVPANLPRYSLQGYISDIADDEVRRFDVQQCFLHKHPEVIWLPGNNFHQSSWARFVVTGVYWIGGFGDRARIGWLPLSEWENATDEDIDSARLPGENMPRGGTII